MPKESASPRAKKSVVKKVSAKKPVKRATQKTTTARKAPTTIKARATQENQYKKQLIISSVICAVIVFSSVGIGIVSGGQINVSETIEKRNDSAIADGGQETKTVPVARQGQEGRPDGGLKGSGKPTPPPAPEPVATTTASTTDETNASSTELVADNEGQDDGAEEVVSEDAQATEEDVASSTSVVSSSTADGV